MPPREPSFSRAPSLCDETSSCESSSSPPPSCCNFNPLGIVLDLDGTLITENDDDLCSDAFLRPGAVEFLRWCRARGHSLAIWTAAHRSWAHYVSWKLCSAVDPQHSCSGGCECQRTFDFVWSAERLRVRKRLPVSSHGQVEGCRWCEQYQQSCNRCECQHGGLFSCPCRSTKDLRKVWKRQRPRFSRHRTILVENTPQQCIHNYGNAVYVPTYDGRKPETDIFQSLRALILRMEQVPDVRTVERCQHGTAPHACLEQNWWYTSSICLPCGTVEASMVRNEPPLGKELFDKLQV